VQTSDFDFTLPEHLVAQWPLPERADSRLLRVQGDALDAYSFRELPGLLRPGDLLIFNDTRVLRARLHGRRASGGRLELLIERIVDAHNVLAQLRASKKPFLGERLAFGEQPFFATMRGRAGALFRLEFESPIDTVLEAAGELPLPPYITRTPDRADETRYQTVFASRPGAVAAPTAGLHFDQPLLAQLQQQGVETAFLTLQVGAGTFQPVRGEDLAQHQMHSEWYEIPASTVDALERTRARGGKVVAVGTTSLRALESSARAHGTVLAGSGETQLFLKPGDRFAVVDQLITNFHLPRSTLMMLVSAFAGTERIRRAYQYAIAQEFRFFSYGDAMLLEREDLSGSATHV